MLALVINPCIRPYHDQVPGLQSPRVELGLTSVFDRRGGER